MLWIAPVFQWHIYRREIKVLQESFTLHLVFQSCLINPFKMLPVCCPGSLQDRDFMLVKCSEKDIVLYKTQEWQTANHTIFWKPDSHSTHFTYIHSTSGNRNVARKCIVPPSVHESSLWFKGSLLTNPHLSLAPLSLKKTHQLRMEGGALRKWRGKLNGHLQVIK